MGISLLILENEEGGKRVGVGGERERERESGRKRERERDTSVASHTCPDWGSICNVGMFPDWGLNPRHFGLWDNAPANLSTLPVLSKYI